MKANEFVTENLRNWFKEKWVRFGPDGKIRGDCARGDDSEGKPKCLPQAKAHALGKKGRASAGARKRREDPNPERSGRAINVNTKKKSNKGVAEGSRNAYLKHNNLVDIEKPLAGLKSEFEKFLQTHDPKEKQKYQQGIKQRIKSDPMSGPKGVLPEQGVAEAQLDELSCWPGHHRVAGTKAGAPGSCEKNKTNEETSKKLNPDAVRRIQQLLNKKFNANLDIDGILGPLTIKSIKKFLPKSAEKAAPNPERNTAVQGKEIKEEKCPECGGPMFSNLMLAEKQDACYNKVKSRYKVWPSAYASGALVQCRKKGAANWGNSGKKNESIEEDQLDEKWTKKYKDSINCSNPKGFSQRAHCAGKQKNEDNTMNQAMSEGTNELYRVLQLSGIGLTEDLNPDQQFDIIEEMVEQLAEEHGVDAEQIWEDFESVDDNELYETAAWRRKEGKSKSGGLNAKGVASYRRENPGSKLQTAVTTKPSKLKPGSKAAKRRKSFCARMGGVKGPMKKPNGKPTRKALALRKWNC